MPDKINDKPLSAVQGTTGNEVSFLYITQKSRTPASDQLHYQPPALSIGLVS